MTDSVATLAHRQGGVVTVAQARLVQGRRDVDRAIRKGDLVQLTRGVLVPRARWAQAQAAPQDLLALRGAARLVRTSGKPVLSHEFAARLWELPLLDHPTGPPSLTVPGPAPRTGGQVGGRHVAPLPLEHLATLRGVPLTSPARTVADLCRTHDPYAALVVADGALAQGLDPAEVEAALALAYRWPYAAAGRRHLAVASRWSESPLESLSLQWCRVHGLPAPQQQLTIRTLAGAFVARTDLVWEDLGVIGELDGRGKYDDLRVLWEEKRREDALRDLGLQVVRGYWADRPGDGAAFVERWRRARARAALSSAPLTCRIVDERDHARRGPLASSLVRAVG